MRTVDSKTQVKGMECDGMQQIDSNIYIQEKVCERLKPTRNGISWFDNQSWFQEMRKLTVKPKLRMGK